MTYKSKWPCHDEDSVLAKSRWLSLETCIFHGQYAVLPNRPISEGSFENRSEKEYWCDLQGVLVMRHIVCSVFLLVAVTVCVLSCVCQFHDAESSFSPANVKRYVSRSMSLA